MVRVHYRPPKFLTSDQHSEEIMKYSIQTGVRKIGNWITSIGYLKQYRLKEGDIVIDCGACFGYFAIQAAKIVGEKGKVIAFEPDKRNFEIFKDNVASSKLNNCILVNKALFNKNTKIGISSNFEKSFIELGQGIFHKDDEVDAITLDCELASLGIKHIDFMKMDVEGAELEIIDGSKEALKNTSNLAIACYHKRNGAKTGSILRPILEQKGFKTKIAFFLHPTLYAKKA
jgi:FkbM family methyltransferase